MGDITWSGILGPDPFGCEVTLVDNGTDWGARINAADVALGAKAGVICCQGGGNIASQIILNTGASSLRTLRFGAGTWTNSLFVDPTILMHSHTVIEGHGWDTILKECPEPDPNNLSATIRYASTGPFDPPPQLYDLTVRNIQISGVGVNRPSNATTGAIITGLVQTGLYQNIWFNKTHGIGLNIGETNPGNAVCQDIRVLGCVFTNVGGATPPDWAGGGGVAFAIINGNRVLVDNCQFIDTLGNAAIDLEPNGAFDPLTNITFSNCLISQENTTGNCEKFVYGWVAHTAGMGTGTFTPSNSGGVLATGTYFVVVGSVNANGTWQHTVQSDPLSITGPNGSIAVSWPAGSAGTTSYNVYYTTANGGSWNETRYISTASLTATITTTTLGGGVVSGTPPSNVGPIEIIGCTFKGTYGQDGGSTGQIFPAGHLFASIYVNYGSSNGQSYQVTAENNTIVACSSFPFVADGANDNVFKNNTCTLIGDDVVVGGFRNVISGNSLTTASQQGGATHGIREGASSDYNSFLNNTVTKASTIVGTHSVISGETVISPPSFTPAYLLPSGTITTTNANDVLIVIAQQGGHLQTLSPLTALQTTNQPPQLGTAQFAPGYQLLTSAGSYTVSWTNTESVQWLVAMLALKGSATLVQQIDAGQMISAQVGLVASTTGGTLATGNYYYRWAGIYHGGEWLTPENSVNVTGPTGSVAVTGNLLNGPAYPSYKLYRGTSPGVYTVSYTPSSLSFTDTGAAGGSGAVPSALSYTGTLGATPTNGNAIVVTYCYQSNTSVAPGNVDLSTVSVGGVALAKGPSVTTPWGITSIWHKENVQGAASGIVTATLAGNPVAGQDKIWFNASEWSGVLTTNAVDAQMATSFPTTWPPLWT